MFNFLAMISLIGCGQSAQDNSTQNNEAQVSTQVGPSSSAPQVGGAPPPGVARPGKRKGPTPPARKKLPYQVFYTNKANLTAGKQPFVAPVDRRDFPEEIEKKALTALFDGPREMEAGVELTACGATGAILLSIDNGLATIKLEGGCGGCGAHSVADLIKPTLKQFDSISVVHIQDPQGQSAVLSNSQDAIPNCLEP